MLPARAAQGVTAARWSWPTRCRSTSSSTRTLHDRTLADGLRRCWPRDGITGKAVTPFLLDALPPATEGASLAVNVRLILRNAELAAPDRRRALGRPAGVAVPA